MEQNKDKPFFIYLAHYGVHTPLQAKKDVIAKYQAKKPAQGQRNPTYAAMLESVDDSVGRIVKKLDELKLSEKTVLVFTSDNGGLVMPVGPEKLPPTSNEPLRLGKGYLYEGGIREPLIVRWPGVVKAGSVCDEPVSSIDYYPTFLELAGVKGDGKHVPDGVSIVPLLKQTGGLKREALFWHYPHYHGAGGKPGGAVRAGDYKLIEFYEDGKRELYNLKDDQGEKADLAAKMPEKVKELAGRLDDWRKAVKAQMPTPNPDYKAE
jgi:arylsulfatase A-like enzyme